MKNIYTPLVKKYRVIIIFIAAGILYSALAPLWMDPDGTYNLAASIKGAKSPFSIYKEWYFGPFYYGWGPFYSWLLLLAHPLFKIMGLTAASVADGSAFAPWVYFVFKWLIKIPFILAGGYLLLRMHGPAAACMWLFNPIVIWFTVLAGLNDIYPSFFVLMGFFFLKNKKMNLFIAAIILGLLAKQTVQLALPALLLMLALYFNRKTLIYFALIVGVPWIIGLPYQIYSHDYQFIMGDNFWQRFPIHLGLGVVRPLMGMNSAVYFTNIIMYVVFAALLVLKKPRMGGKQFALWSLTFYLTYMRWYGKGMDRWSLTMLPFLLLVCINAREYFSRRIYLLFWAFSCLPPLIQIAWRDYQFKMQPEVYTAFANTSLPFRLFHKFAKPELAPENMANYLVSAQAGLILVFFGIWAYLVIRDTGRDERDIKDA